jgi:hypothetical protein
MSKPVFPQTPAKDENFNRTGGLLLRELAAIEIAAQMSGAITFSALDDAKKAKNLAAIPTIAVEIADALEALLRASGGGLRQHTVESKEPFKSTLIVLPKGGEDA